MSTGNSKEMKSLFATTKKNNYQEEGPIEFHPRKAESMRDLRETRREWKPTEKMKQYLQDMADRKQGKPNQLEYTKKTETSNSGNQVNKEKPCTKEYQKSVFSTQEEENTQSLHSFEDTYLSWKRGIQNMRISLRNELSEDALGEIMDIIEALRDHVIHAFERLPSSARQIVRRRVDTCMANTDNLISLAHVRMSEVDIVPWDQEGETARIRMILDTEYARSVYGSKFSEASMSDHMLLRKSSTSQHSGSGSFDSIAYKRAEAAANLAAKEAELRALGEEEEKRAYLKTELQKMDAEKEIKIEQARIAAYDKELGQFPSNAVPKSPVQLDSSIQPEVVNSQTRTEANAFGVYTVEQVLSNNLTAVSQAFQETLDYNQLPKHEMTTFSGDPLKFVKWRRSFESLVAHKKIRPGDKLALLERYVTGDAAGCIEGMFYRNDEDAFDDAWKLLNERYGHPSIVLSSFRNKLSAWPKIGGRDYTGLQTFTDFLVAIDNASSHITSLRSLNDAEENKKILLKLPDWIITKWGNVVDQNDEKGFEYPTFHEFIQFLTHQAKMATRPVCSLHALKEEQKSNLTDTKRYPKNKQANTLMTGRGTDLYYAMPRNDVRVLTSNSNPSGRQKNCVFCKATDHYLPNCSAFTKKDLPTRRQFVKDQKRCFKCLRTGHGSKGCTKPHSCNTCKGQHPSCLHDNHKGKAKVNDKENEQMSNPTEAINLKVNCGTKTTSHSSTTIPVWLSSKHNPKEEKLVYALLDSQSDTTFVTKPVIDQFSLPKSSKQTTCLRMSTINGKSQSTVIKVIDLQVRGFKGDTFIELPQVYTVDHIPLRPQNIPTCDVAKNWAHLQGIADKLPPLLNCEPGILIGFDCSRAFLPKEYIVGGDLKPFAVRTELGWSIVGKNSPDSTDPIKKETSMCNRVATKESPVLSPNEACHILEKDFHQDKHDAKLISQEDIQFTQVLEKEIKKDSSGHYQMPLPFKKTPSLPNNFEIAVKRLEHLKRKLSKNEDYYREYCQFMEEIIKRGNCEEASQEAKSGQESYIPHHGVYHPQMKKLRVVFDCSAKFKDTSLNDHLMVGPNLINNLLGVLCRFRQHPIAIICDVEKMFHQFKVNKEHRDFLRFLWWEEGDLQKSPKAYRMTVHLFGATSSPGCANFALKYMAKENQEKYPTAAQFIIEDFYVDDGLTSQETEQEAVNLVKETTILCAEGGLKLHKFASNSRTVLETIPASERAPNIQALDLNFNELPMERTLGMQWLMENDTIHFSFSPNDKPPTRRGILATVASLYDPLGLIAPFILTGKHILQQACDKGTQWDDVIPAELLHLWQAWKKD